MSNNWKHACSLNTRKNYYDCRITNSVFKRPVEIFWHMNERYKCDIHAGYAELENCIKKDYRNLGKIHYLTMLRNPQERYLSEFQHVKKGATWVNAIRRCLYLEIYSKKCYGNKKDWSYVEFQDFLNCEYNLANNRQVRMLANYNRIGCNKLNCWLKSSNCSLEMKKQFDNELLESAKETLLSVSFFGLTEYQNYSFSLFEKTFENKLKFSQPFPLQTERLGQKLLEHDFKDYLNEINEKNHLDIQLYDFAKELFFQRISGFII